MKSKLIKLSGLFLIMGMLIVLSLGAAGCGDQEGATPTPPAQTTINISGSTSVQPISEALSQAYMEKNSGVKIFVQGGGSSAGIKAAQEGAADIGTSSRELKPEEKNLTETVIAKDGIAILVHPNNKVSDLTLEQIKGIFAGTITNWQAVGGEDKAITVVTREEGSGTRGAFEEIVLGKDAKMKASAIVQGSTGAVRSTVAGDPQAIGYASLASVDQTVKAVAVNGIAPSAATTLDGTYKISRPFLYLTKTAPTGDVKQLIDFILSSEGQALIEKEGLVKVK